MHVILGVLVLVVGVTILGWWGSTDHAHDMEAGIADRSEQALGETIHGVTSTVAGRDITVQGYADTQAEKEAILERLDDVHGRRLVRDDLTVLPVASPYVFRAEKNQSGQIASGNMPTQAQSAKFADLLGGAYDFELATGMPDSAWPDVAANGVAALSELEAGQIELTDQALKVSGAVQTRAERDAIIANVGNLPAGYTLINALEIFDDGTPMRLDVSKGGDSDSVSGKLPFGMGIADVQAQIPAATAGALTTAEIDDDMWSGLAQSGLAALAKLETGTLTIVGPDLSLSGFAMTPTDVAAAKQDLADLADGYTVTVDITSLDDGMPNDFEIAYDVQSGAAVSGKFPAGFSIADVAASMNVAGVSGAVTSGATGDATDAKLALATIADWLPELDAATVTQAGDQLTLDVVVSPGGDVAQIRDALTAELGDSVTVRSPEALPETGSRRANVLTGQTEQFQGLSWLPVYDFIPSVLSCQGESLDVLAEHRVNFLSGQAVLDAKALRAINPLAGIMAHCFETTDLAVEIAGHTDSTGDAAQNQELSQQRADAVRQALIDRGVRGDLLTPIGYGADQPIASNDTAEGRAANRRTETLWSEPVLTETNQAEEQ